MVEEEVGVRVEVVATKRIRVTIAEVVEAMKIREVVVINHKKIAQEAVVVTTVVENIAIVVAVEVRTDHLLRKIAEIPEETAVEVLELLKRKPLTGV